MKDKICRLIKPKILNILLLNQLVKSCFCNINIGMEGKRKLLIFGLILAAFMFPTVWPLLASEQAMIKARVLEIRSEEKVEIPGTEASAWLQEIKVKILDSDKRGEEIVIDNDYTRLKVGDTFFLRYITDQVGEISYTVTDVYRLPILYFVVALFVLAVIIFGGWPGVRGLVALVGSLLLIFFVLFPAIVAGYSPIVISVLVSSLIVVIGSYITHGFNKTTTSAVLGMLIAILFTGFLAYATVTMARLTGFGSEEAIFLNLTAGLSIDFVGLLLGGILIGILGVLYDAAISQAVAVEELNNVGDNLSRRFVFKRVLRMGREHIGALVNTLAIAYVGAALPLLLLFYHTAADLGQSINKEIFAVEIIRTMVGSIGIILAVPITTLIAVWLLVKRD